MLVGLHMLGSMILVVAAVSVLLTTRERVIGDDTRPRGLPSSAENEDVDADRDEHDGEIGDGGVEQAHRPQTALR